MSAQQSCFTLFKADIDAYSLPERFTFPFYYQAHPLCQLAAKELQQHLLTQSYWTHNFGKVDGAPLPNYASPSTLLLPEIGKMFGVLVVRHSSGQLGYLSAFSGKLANQNHLPHFVPPIFDMLTNDGFFLTETKIINKLNDQITQRENDPTLHQLQHQLTVTQQQADAALAKQRQLMILHRQQRKQQREDAEQLTDRLKQKEIFTSLAKQSVAEKNQLQQLKQVWEQRLNELNHTLELYSHEINQLKAERKQRSNTLQQQLFEQYQFLNIAGEKKSLHTIFRLTAHPTPPAGSGECAAPKLLHYAFKHNMQPIAMAEFWWGASPKSEIRRHQQFYPACQSKCLPILTHMLKGLNVDENPMLQNIAEHKKMEIVYQDHAIVVVNKPEELLSVPGINIQDSVLSRLQSQFLNDDAHNKESHQHSIDGVFVIHRLDMATSGLLVFALTKRANKHLQKQFIARSVEKRYVALIEGQLTATQGDIELPLRGDLDDRPRQLVCFEQGKKAQTHWQLISVENNKSRVYLYPKTGRTHQLRVHCAHIDGLNKPIVGDDLYGTKAERLCLHAETLIFQHPYTNQTMRFQVDADF